MSTARPMSSLTRLGTYRKQIGSHLHITPKQRRRYLKKMNRLVWGGTHANTQAPF